LFQRKLDVGATQSSIAIAEKIKSQSEVQKRIMDDLLEKTLKDLDGKKVILKAKASTTHLFASIHKKEVVAAIKSNLNLEIPEEFLILEHPLKDIGTHTIIVKSNTAKAGFELLIEAE